MLSRLYFILLLIPLFIQAQDTTGIKLEDTFDVVDLDYRLQNRMPISLQQIQGQELKLRSTGQEPSFILAQTPSMTNYSDAGSMQGYSYFRLRGIDQTRINMTYDGVPMNEPEDQGAYFSNYPDIFNGLSSIQIQRGVGSTQNGVAAYAGSIQLFSPNLRDTTRYTFGLNYGSFNTIRAFFEYNSGVEKNGGIYLRTSGIYSDGFKQSSSNFSQSVQFKTGLFYDKHNWQLNVLAGHQQNAMAWLGVSDSLIELSPRINSNAEQENDEFYQTMVQLQNNWQVADRHFLKTSVYYTFLDGNYDFDFNNYLGLASTDELYNYDFQSHWLGLFSTWNYTKNTLDVNTSLHLNNYRRRHLGSEKSLGELYRNTGYKNEAALYVKTAYRLKDVQFFLDVQYRYCHFAYDGTVEMDAIDWHFINPKFGLSYLLSDRILFYASLGRNGREPTRNDMFGGYDDLAVDEQGNPLLQNTEAESVMDYELGWRWIGPKHYLNLNAYYMDFSNEIVLNGQFGPNGLALTRNVDQSLRTGVELEAQYQLSKHFSLRNNSSFNYSLIQEQSENFHPILSPFFIINQEFIYEWNRLLWAVELRYQDASYIDFANSRKIDAYLLVNTRFGYRHKGFELLLYLNNLTNALYYNNAYLDVDGRVKYFVQAPTNFTVAMKYSF